MRTSVYRALCLSAAVLALASSARSADEPLAEIKALYAAASFEDALAALERIDTLGSAGPEALEYKALCLLALGRAAEAQLMAEAIVSATPAFVPVDADLSPRFVTLLTDTRRRMVPEIARRLYADGRDQFHAKNQAQAKLQFAEVVALADDPIWRNLPEAADLRTLAAGFLELASAATLPAPAPLPVAPPIPEIGRAHV